MTGASELPCATEVVVIGGGHNGLVAACYLARAGHDVVVLEACPTVGGMSASARPIPGAPDHVINTCSAEFVWLHRSPVLWELELERYGLRMLESDPPYAYLHPDGSSIAFWKDANRTVAEIEQLSRADAGAYREWAELLDAFMALATPYLVSHPYRLAPKTLVRIARSVVSSRRQLRRLLGMLSESGDAVVETRFQHPTVRSAVYSLIAGATSVSAEGTGMAGAFLAFIHSTGAMRPVGGMQALPDALCRCLTEAGGTIVTDAIVETIDVRDGAARGVRLQDGRTITADRAVLAACDVRQTIGTLLPSSALDPETRRAVAAAPANGLDNAWVKVDLAFSGRLRPSRHEQWRGDGLDLRRPAIMIGEMDKVRRAYGLSAAGLVPPADDLLQWAFCSTGIDTSQAPDGMDTLYLAAPTMPLHPADDWDAQLTGTATHAMLEQARTYYDGLDQEIGRVIETPPDLINRLRTGNGCLFHVDFSPFRSGPLRPAFGVGGYRAPVERLYLSGAGTHPGGGVSGLPGRLAAQQVIRDQRHPWRNRSRRTDALSPVAREPVRL